MLKVQCKPLKSGSFANVNAERSAGTRVVRQPDQYALEASCPIRIALSALDWSAGWTKQRRKEANLAR
jgi:hypothetical protein